MKIAFLIFAHHSPQNLTRLISGLDDPHFDIFVHMDAKANLQDFQLDTCKLTHSRLYLVPHRVFTHWADISLLDAMLYSYRYALSVGNYDWFVTLSGEDYPIQSNSAIYTYLAQRHTDCICISHSLSPARIQGYWFWKLHNRLLVRTIRKGLHCLGIRKKPYFTVNGKRWVICKSSQWHALTQASVRHILSIMDQFPCIRRYFQFSHAPDELVIPTILYNSPPSGSVPIPSPSTSQSFHNLAAIHFLEYNPHKGSSVTVFDESAYSAAIASKKLFLRKVRHGKSDTLMDLLDHFRNEVPAPQDSY